jgi:hypothetical protein
VHKLCRKKKHLQWQRMTRCGVVDGDLLRLLLAEYADNYSRLVRLMVKFGLLVRLQSEDSRADTHTHTHSASNSDSDCDTSQYLVPALLPCAKPQSAAWSDQHFSTCYLLFTTSKELERFTTISRSDLEVYGFLPQGLFERLLGKAVTWVSERAQANSQSVSQLVS